jgi:hypothetical protein
MANVEPIPNYEIYTTNEKNEKVFVLIRIQEGDNTPYYVQNDSNIWVRTGNISTPIDIASPDRLALLFTNKEKAEKIRNLYIKKADEVYISILNRAERDRLRKIDELKNQGKESTFYANPINGDGCICEIAVQPYFPKKSLARPKDIKDNLISITPRAGNFDFPNSNIRAIPDGILSFNSSRGKTDCQQIYGQGLIISHLNIERDKDGIRNIFLSYIAARLIQTLRFANNFYNHFGYQGSLRGFISIKNTKDVYITEIIPSGYIQIDEDNESFISSYSWEIETDTNIIGNAEQLNKYFASLLRDIYWHFGCDDISDKRIQDFLKQNGLEL